jgi:hypothetical protein
MAGSKQRSGTSSIPVYRRLHGGSSRGPVGADARRGGFDQIVPTEPMRVSVDRTRLTAVALEQSRIVVSFGHGTQRLESRADTVPGTDGE